MKRVALFFGGLSNEAEISIISALNIEKNFDNKKYKLKRIFWDKKDRNFYLVKSVDDRRNKKKIEISQFKKHFDIAFLITHGKYGEDGVLQSILESQGIKYTGCGVLSSALCMDKIMLKNLLKNYHILQVEYLGFDLNRISVQDVIKEIKLFIKKVGFPIYIKPSNSGSSVGISKVRFLKEIKKAVKEAKKHDTKLLIEQGIEYPREIEIAVLGNNDLTISEPGELELSNGFYNYEDKYIKGETKSIIPARLNRVQRNKIKKIAERVYRLADCNGFARIDFFIKNDKIYLNEINTLPGFTDISMFPMLMQNSGINYTKLINQIIKLAK